MTAGGISFLVCWLAAAAAMSLHVWFSDNPPPRWLCTLAALTLAATPWVVVVAVLNAA